MKKLGFTLLVFLLAAQLVPAQDAAHKNLCDYVDPFIGTQEMGHTFPGATVPFGMVQLSPETDTIPYSVNFG
jgi:putative alpha-1,2-mannosidase